jgi:hypothetical protein
MNLDADLLKAAASLFSEFAWARLLPALSLAVVMGGLFLLALAAHRNAANPFDLVEFFRDETTNKLSFKRLTNAVCCGAHTWFIWIRTTNNTITWEDVALYAGVWSGSTVALEALSVWRGIATPKPAEGTRTP